VTVEVMKQKVIAYSNHDVTEQRQNNVYQHRPWKATQLPKDHDKVPQLHIYPAGNIASPLDKTTSW